ncbi:MAG: type VI secretion system-associated protein TagF [Desulfobacterales bacterium]|nr:type VI secretion system-associated protein TagF [Desulfobacterales bacterium]
MLGSIRSRNNNDWEYIACGKHPIAGDYFQVGSSDPILKAFSDWVENGYRLLNRKRNPNDSANHYSWRFWSKGPRKGSLICGVVVDSSDRLGRRYPFLIMGKGFLIGWENYWDLLPFALDKIWGHMQYLSYGRFIDFKQLEDNIRSIKSPQAQWAEFSSQREKQTETELSKSSTKLNPDFRIDLKEVKESVRRLSNGGDLFVSLKIKPLQNSFGLAALWNFHLKTHTHHVPNAVFMGGIPEEEWMAVFQRPLVTQDFVRLWSIGSKCEG